MSIPPRLHFCWIGSALPWAYAFAILSAAARSGLDEIILHHTDVLDDSPAVRTLSHMPNVRLSGMDPGILLGEVGRRLGLGEALTALYRRLDGPVMRSDLLRAAILYRFGGVYLDLDTITVRPLLALLDARQFVGTEFIIWPRNVRAARSPRALARPVALDLARKLLRRLPRGWAAFRHVERHCFRIPANSAMGAEPDAPLLGSYLRAMPTAIPAGGKAPGSYALGADLLGDVISRGDGSGLVLHDPHVFFPLPPEISEHWFHADPDPRLDRVLANDTKVVHWYASIRSRARVAQITPHTVWTCRRTQLYSALVHATLGDLLTQTWTSTSAQRPCGTVP